MGALARNTDPLTSYEAADSQTPHQLTAVQSAIWLLLRGFGPMNDATLYERFVNMSRMSGGAVPMATPQSVRSRRATLVLLGKVRATDQHSVTAYGRRSIVWEHVEPSQNSGPEAAPTAPGQNTPAASDEQEHI